MSDASTQDDQYSEISQRYHELADQVKAAGDNYNTLFNDFFLKKDGMTYAEVEKAEAEYGRLLQEFYTFERWHHKKLFT